MPLDLTFKKLSKTIKVLQPIPTEPHPIGYRIVRETDIPQPWQERFLRASLGSTRVADGICAHDRGKFLDDWESEMLLLQKHRADRAARKLGGCIIHAVRCVSAMPKLVSNNAGKISGCTLRG